ncbi:Glutathione ABC transporter permease GsiC [Hyphomicrobiales bacterium]|nr:Glutathione ABC transporter permease GsiC [Hyphomicrobiales bacterium]CAH1691298.1 Glutathione ABC transporter permease GsiC [Hyphomicrobiales bacterium]
MLVWLLRRLALSVVLVWLVASIVFMAIHLVPGDPAELLLSQGGGTPSEAAIQALRTELGLDRPIFVQYFEAMERLLHFDLGRSMQDGVPIFDEVAKRLPRTLELILAAAIVSVAIAIPAGTYAALRAGGPFDRIFSTLAGLSLAVPVFVVGTLLVLVFAQYLRWLPAGQFVPFSRNPGRHMLILIMPSLTIASSLLPIIFRMTRSSVLDVMQMDFVRTARAKGVRPLRIVFHHIVRAALTPVVTVLALHMGALLGGTVLVEYVFNWPGLSGLLVSAVNARDYPAVVGVILVISVVFVLLNLFVDVLYGLIDPRGKRA